MPLPYVDPHKRHGRWYRMQERFGRTRAADVVARRILWHIDPWLYRVTGGRYPRAFGGLVSAPLITTGAKTGQPRKHQLAYFHDGPDPILIASNAGAPKHPQWYHNLKAHPQCQLGDERFTATEVTDPEEHARLYSLAEQVWAGYADYREKAAAIGRHIPIFRLRSA